MSVIFANPPLIEALCQFQFLPGKPWDFTVPGLLYARVSDEFPDTQMQPALPAIQVNFADGQATSGPVDGTTGVMQFLRRDKAALLQLWPNALIVNHLRPYPHWEAFRDLILRNLSHYVEVAHPIGLLQIQLRFINRIDVPSSLDLDQLTQYSAAVPGLPPVLTHDVNVRFGQRVELDFPKAQGILVIQSGLVPSEVTGQTGFLLDLTFVSTFHEAVPLDATAQWVERAHAEVERAFLACYTPTAKETFGEITNG